MRIPRQSRLASIVLSTTLLVAFGLLEGPVLKPFSRARGPVEVHEAVEAQVYESHLQVTAGKSIIVDSPARIVRVSVDNPQLAQTISIDSHQLVVNGKVPGRTTLTLWQEDGHRSALELNVESAEAQVDGAQARQEFARQAVAASYENAMSRVQSAITGTAR